MLQSSQKFRNYADAHLVIDNTDGLQSASADGIIMCDALSRIQFWCGDNTIHLTNPDYSSQFCCLTHVVGLPRHPATNEEMPLTPYQIDFVNRIIDATKAPTAKQFKRKFKEILDKFLKKANFFHINKGRQMGFTEIILRLIQFFCFSRYAGYNIGIMAATNGNLAKKDQRRFARLFKNIPQVVTQWIKNNVMKLINGTIIEAFPASEEALTGDTKYKCIFLDEAAKWKLVNDTPVFNSVEPIIRAAGGDLFLVSTPKGPIKMFYKIYSNKESEYQKLEYDIWQCEGNLYTREQIEEMLASATSDPDQEYLCKFTVGEDSILGRITDEDRGENWTTWDMEDSEDDNFVEQDDTI